MAQKANLLSILLIAGAFAAGYAASQALSSPQTPRARSVPGGEEMILEADAAAFRKILLDPNVLERTTQLAERLRRSRPEALDAVLQAYETVFLDAGDVELILLAEWWAGFDPEGAARWAKKEYAAQHPAVGIALFRAWARQDPQAAVLAVMTGGFGQLVYSYHNAAVKGWDESGQPGLLDHVQQTGTGEFRQRALMTLARSRVLREGVDATLGWADRVSDADPKFKLNLFRRVAAAAAEVDPQKASAWVSGQLEDEYGSSLPQFVSTRWAKQDGAAAMAWLSTLPEGTDRTAGVREAFVSWTTADYHGARSWVAAQDPAQPWIGPAAALYAHQLANEDPLAALAWADRIHDDELRRATLGRCARSWLLKDKAAATEWIENSSLPDDFKRRIYTIPSGMKPRERR